MPVSRSHGGQGRYLPWRWIAHRIPALRASPRTPRVQQQTRRRVLKLFERRAVLPEDATELMLGWEHSGGFSLNAEVWVPCWDRAGLERLLRYCARPIFAGERLAWVEPDERLIYHLPTISPGAKLDARRAPAG